MFLEFNASDTERVLVVRPPVTEVYVGDRLCSESCKCRNYQTIQLEGVSNHYHNSGILDQITNLTTSSHYTVVKGIFESCSGFEREDLQ